MKPIRAYISLQSINHDEDIGELRCVFLAHLSKEDKDANCTPLVQLNLVQDLQDFGDLDMDIHIWDQMKANYRDYVNILED